MHQYRPRHWPGDSVSAALAELEAFDWSDTPLGPRDRWPASLEAIYAMMLGTPVAMCATWGPEQPLLYNAAYVPFLAKRHRRRSARPLPTCGRRSGAISAR